MNIPYRSFALTALMLAGFGAPDIGHAQVAGSTTFSADVVDVQLVAMGWSAKKQILGTSVYNDADELVGKIADIIVAPDSSVSTAIIGVGGFIGVGRHEVAIPVSFFRLDEGKHALRLPGATRALIKSLPEFKYAGGK